MSLTVVTFATPEYADCIPHFDQACKELLLDYHCVKMESTGRWLTNTRLKPQAVLEARHQIRGPIWYLDIDGKVLNKPKVPIDIDWDVGVVTNPRKEHKNRISSQCIMFNDTLEALQLIAWWNFSTLMTNTNDHPNLTQVLKFARSARTATIIDADVHTRGCWQFNAQKSERSQPTLIT